MFKILIILALLSFPLVAFSAVRTWDGGGPDANWQTAMNWVGDVTPAPGDDLVFPANAAQFATNNDLFVFLSFNSITIEGGAYTFGGNAVRLVNGINVGSGTHTFNIPVVYSAAQTLYAGAGSTTIIAAVSVGSFGLRIDGDGSFGIGLLSGSGGVNKVGNGASLIAAAAGFSGAIFIGNGILIVDANLAGSNVIVEAPNGGLGGTGTVGAVTVMTGNVSAGTVTSPTGILNTGSIQLFGSGAFLCKIGGTTPGANGHDQLNATGTVNLISPRLIPVPWNGFRPAIGDTYLIVRNDGTDPVNGTFMNLPEGRAVTGPLNTAFRITYHGGDGNDVVLTRIPRTMFDFDADGRADISAFTQNGWFVHWSSLNQTFVTSNGTPPRDIITPADFDGDNRTDIAVYGTTVGSWYIINSTTTAMQIKRWGLPGDIPVPNDFDGDGRADLTIFRPSTGDWWIQRSFDGLATAQHFGQNGDTPLVGDFDGDGLGDLAVYRPSEGAWYIQRSSDNGFFAFPFGLSTDLPVPADYDGDGKTDAAIFRATADGTQPDFYVLRSSDLTIQYGYWGSPGDIPVVADYDGDGKADYAVVRPGPGGDTWYLLQTTAGFTYRGFETSVRPVPAAYVR